MNSRNEQVLLWLTVPDWLTSYMLFITSHLENSPKGVEYSKIRILENQNTLNTFSNSHHSHPCLGVRKVDYLLFYMVRSAGTVFTILSTLQYMAQSLVRILNFLVNGWMRELLTNYPSNTYYL